MVRLRMPAAAKPHDTPYETTYTKALDDYLYAQWQSVGDTRKFGKLIFTGDTRAKANAPRDRQTENRRRCPNGRTRAGEFGR